MPRAEVTPSQQLERVLDRLRDLGGPPPKPRGKEWEARCPNPAHPDGDPSFSACDGDDGVLLHCQIGCSLEAMLGGLGMVKTGLFYTKKSTAKPRIVATYRYLDEQGEVLFEKVRREPGKDGRRKDFLQRRSDGKGGWIWSLTGVRRVLYNLPEVLAAIADGRDVYVVEGEKDVETLRRHGLVATCNVEGAAKPAQRSKWRREYTQQLDGVKRVVVVADRDESGYAHSEYLADELEAVVGEVVRAVGKPDFAKADVTDHFDAGFGVEDLVVVPNYRVVSAQPPHGASSQVNGDTASTAYTASGGTGQEGKQTYRGEFWPTLHEAAYHGLAGEVVRSVAPHTEAAPEGLLLALLTGVAALMGGSAYVKPDGAAAQPPRIFTVLAGPSARGRKGTAWEAVLPILRRVDEGWVSDGILSGLSTGEGVIAALADEGRDDKRMIVRESEFARTLVRAGEKGSILSMVIRELFDSGNLQLPTRRNPLNVRDAHVCMHAHITAAELTARLSDTDMASGFGNRFLFALVRRSKLITTEHNDLGSDQIDDFAGRLALVTAAARLRGRLSRSQAAQRLWERLYPVLSDEDKAPDGLLGALLARGDVYVLRLALIYALLDWSSHVCVPHLRAALAVWRYCEQSAGHLFAHKSGSELSERLLDALEEAGEVGMSLDVQRDYFGRNVPAAELHAARGLLERQGKIRTEKAPPSGRGRPPTVSYFFSRLGRRDVRGDSDLDAILAEEPEADVLSGQAYAGNAGNAEGPATSADEQRGKPQESTRDIGEPQPPPATASLFDQAPDLQPTTSSNGSAPCRVDREVVPGG